MSKVSIVMATYNGEKYMKEQIESILSNSYTDWTLEICDDGSTDGTILMGKDYEKKYPEKIRVHENPRNLGLVLNFLEGAKRATADYIMFCDQDDVWLPQKIEKTLLYMKTMEQKCGQELPISVFTDAVVVDKKLQELSRSFHESGKLDCSKLDLPHILMENKLLGCTVMFNRALKEKLVILPTTARVHDWWVALLSSSFGSIGYLKEVTMLYRQHDNNVIGNQNFISYVANRIHSLKRQKKVLQVTQSQARNFYELFKEELPDEERKILREFAFLHQCNWFSRRVKVLKYGFCKTGVIRNIGVLLLI